MAQGTFHDTLPPAAGMQRPYSVRCRAGQYSGAGLAARGQFARVPSGGRGARLAALRSDRSGEGY